MVVARPAAWTLLDNGMDGKTAAFQMLGFIRTQIKNRWFAFIGCPADDLSLTFAAEQYSAFLLSVCQEFLREGSLCNSFTIIRNMP